MPDQSQRTPVLPGLIGRLVNGIRYTITGIGPTGWFDPGQPLLPVAPDHVAGRAYDYPVGYNLAIQPRAWEGTGYEEILTLADSYDVARLLIETRKDQMSRLSWTIRKRDENQGRVGGQRRAQVLDSTAGKIQAFLEYPNKRDDWSSWLRQALEQVLVPDALTIYPVRTKGGDLYSLELLDGTTIAPRIGSNGRRPNPPDVAYQQIIKGLPAVDYTADELIYMPRNRRVDKVYGFSPIEQTIVTINIALRRQASQLYYFTQGNTPDALVSCPPEWTVEQIKEFQKYWDTLFEDNLGARRMTKFVPGLQNYQPTKDKPLSDEFDDYINRVLCFAFSISPQALIKQMNRAAAQAQQAQAIEEGLFPYMQYVKSIMDYIIRHHAGFPEYEFVWETDTWAAPADRVQILTKYVLSGVMTPNEARTDLGLPEVEGGDVLFIPSSLASVEDVASGEARSMGGGGQAFGTLNGREKGRQAPTPGKGDPGSGKTVRERTSEAVSKAEVAEPGDSPFALPSRPRHHDAVHLGRPSVKNATEELANYLRSEFSRIGDEARRGAAAALASVNKAANEPPHEKDLADRIIDNLGLILLLVPLAPTMRLSLLLIAQETAGNVADRLNASSAEVGSALQDADDYATRRSAELLGASRNLVGDLVRDEHADRSIIDSSRRMLRRELEAGITGGLTGEKISAVLADVFSSERADRIAQFEIDSASNAGALAALQATAPTRSALRKYWFALVNCCDECDRNAAAGPIMANDTFPSGHHAPLAHLHCRCELLWTESGESV